MFFFYLLQIFQNNWNMWSSTDRKNAAEKKKWWSGLHGVSESILKDDVVSTWLRWMSPSNEEGRGQVEIDREREREETREAFGSGMWSNTSSFPAVDVKDLLPFSTLSGLLTLEVRPQGLAPRHGHWLRSA